ncbi:MAG: phosphatidate cytidylyltransferase [Cytophagales bacterium]
MFNFGSLTNLQQRIIFGILGALAVVNSIIWSEWSFFVLFFVISMFAQQEFYQLLIEDKKKPNDIFGTVIGLVVYTLAFFIEKKFLSVSYYMALFPLCALIFIFELYYSKKKPFNNVAYTFLGVLYVAIPFTVLVVIAFVNGDYSWQIVLGVLMLLWASDTGAYFAGRKLGKHKLFPRVSPGKTWEGAIGGGLLSLLTSWVLSIYFTDLKSWQWPCLSVIIVVSGIYGDLVESSFKRSLEIKDSGSAIPGHGGFLDRFDGLLLASPFVITFLQIFKF